MLERSRVGDSGSGDSGSGNTGSGDTGSGGARSEGRRSGAARLEGMWRRLSAIAQKEVRQLLRDRLTLGMMVGIPMLQILLFGYAINLDVRGIPTALLDRSQSSRSRELVGDLVATQAFLISHRVFAEADALRLLERGSVQSVIVIPPDLDQKLYRGVGAKLSIWVDASNPTIAGAVTQAANGLERRISQALEARVAGERAPVGQRLARTDALRYPTPDRVERAPLRLSVLPLYNPERRTAVFIVPGLIGTILTMTMMLMTAVALVRERERGTLEFLIATPVRRGEVILGKLAPYVLLGHLQIVLILTLGVWLFGMPIHGSLFDLTAASAVFIAAMLALGLAISARALNQFQAMQLSFFVFLPSILLSGFMFPFEAMPRVARWIGELLPLTHYLRLVRGILLRGGDLSVFGYDLAVLAGFALVVLVLATRSFRKSLG